MKILLLSDLHTEFTNNNHPAPQIECDVIVLAGDIGVGLNSIKLANKWNEELNVPIVIINGNHEYYSNSIYQQYKDFNLFKYIQFQQKSLCNENVHFLENENVIIDGVRFLGCTFWTNFRTNKKLSQWDEMMQARYFLNDYRICYYESDKLLTPQNTLDMHKKSKKWLSKELKKQFDGKTIVVTHHSPILEGVNPIYLNDKSGGFCNKMDSFIKNHSNKINAWFFGHTHYNVNLDVNGVMVVSNQCGYPSENVNDFNYNVIEL